ncbi:MAG: PQQ-dependent sugar dehydrogenase [Salinivirgaceae bacterium]
MKKSFVFSLLALVFLPGSAFTIKSNIGWFFENGNINRAEMRNPSELYQNFCAGCHGNQMEEFIDRSWKYGEKPVQIETAIAKGIPDEGMPGFKDAFTFEEIKALTEYILAESRTRGLKKAAESTNNSGIYGTDVKYKVETVVEGLEIPWGLEFLPNGDMLIAERNGTLSRFTKDKKLVQITGLPPVLVAGQGGLMEVKKHPDYQNNGYLYFAYSYFNDKNKNEGNTAIIRGKLDENKLTSIETIFKGTPLVTTRHHFGSRMAFDNDGHLYFSIGDRGKHDEFAQSLDNSNGKIHRLNDDGTLPSDNPFINTPGAQPSIFSYGHRNPQGVARHPVTGEIWTHEHGPRGGDEINIITKGKNYGWPLITFGINYNGTIITTDTARVGMEQPLYYYVPSIAPCGMDFVTGKRYKGWEHSLLIGSLRFEYLERVEIKNNKVVKRETLLPGIGRVRNVQVSPDGYIYVGVENPGRILKLVPVDE